LPIGKLLSHVQAVITGTQITGTLPLSPAYSLIYVYGVYNITSWRVRLWSER